MAIQEHPNQNKNDNNQFNKMRPAPKLQRARSKAGEGDTYPEKLQYTGKNLRVDYLQSHAAAAEAEAVAKNVAQSPAASKTEAAIAKAKAQAQLSRQSSVQKPSVQKAASRKTADQQAASLNNAGRQAAAAKTGRREEAAKKTTDEKKRQRLMLIVAGVLIVAILLVFGVSSLLKRDPDSDPGSSTNPPVTTEPGPVAWTEAELEAAKLALSKEVIFPGIHIAGIDMSGLSAEEARDVLAEEAERLRDKIKITVRANDESFTLSAEDLAYNFDTFSALEKAWSVGRSSEHYNDDLDLILRYQVISAIEKEGLHIDLDGDFDEAVMKYSLQKKLSDLLPVFTEAKATGFNTTTLRFEVENGQVGLEADLASAIKDLHRLLQQDDFQGEIVLKLEEKQPEMTADMIYNNTGFISQASTPIYGSWQADRNYNLIVAAKKMNGQVVQPGETYSYLTSLGPITTQAGFMSGSAIVGGTYIDVIGGGLCQPSTTLFQAAVKADLEIVERHNHGMRSDYYYYGQDAMIYGGSFDFKFKNNTDYPLAIVAETSGNYLVYKLYGRPLPAGVTIEMDSVKTGDLTPITTTQKVLNTKLEPGESEQVLTPIVGSTWETYKVYYKNGVEFDRQYLTYSRYPSVARRIEYGPSLPPTETVPETEPTTEAPTTASTAAPTAAPTEPVTEPPTEAPEP